MSRTLLAQQAWDRGNPGAPWPCSVRSPRPPAAGNGTTSGGRGRAVAAPRRSSSLGAVACSPDGRLIVAGGSSGQFAARDAGTGEERNGFPSVRNVTSLAFTPDDKSLAVASGADGKVGLGTSKGGGCGPSSTGTLGP